MKLSKLMQELLETFADDEDKDLQNREVSQIVVNEANEEIEVHFDNHVHFICYNLDEQGLVKGDNHVS